MARSPQKNLITAKAQHDRLTAALAQAQADLDALIVSTVRGGCTQTQVAGWLGVTKARVNHIVKAAPRDVSAPGEPTHQEVSDEQSRSYRRSDP